MAIDVRNFSLSALSPIKLAYNYNSLEKLKADYRVVSNGSRYYKQELLNQCADGAFSQHNALILTDVKKLKNLFEKTIEEQNIKNFGACFYLSVTDTDYLAGEVVVTNTNSGFYVGGTGNKSLFNVLPLGSGIVELKYNGFQIAVNENYPYDLELLPEPLQENIYRQQFEIEIYKNKIAFKANTIEGVRYLSYGLDRKLRFVGVQLNETIVNEYLFTPIFVTSSTIEYDFDPSTKEVRYFNQIETTNSDRTLEIKEQTDVDTSLLVSCALKDVTSDKEEVPVNIAITKTNFTTTGTFNASL